MYKCDMILFAMPKLMVIQVAGKCAIKAGRSECAGRFLRASAGIFSPTRGANDTTNPA